MSDPVIVSLANIVPPLPSHWVWSEEDRTWSIRGANCWIWMSPRPPHCDRGNWLAHVEPLGPYDPVGLSIDYADLWPRYYFDLDRARLECEAWLKKRNQWVPDGESPS
jgi:hypothetical protein